MLLVAASLWFANPAPLDMPRAEAYLVTEANGDMRLEDRYDEMDLWTSRAVSGRWEDDDGRVFTLARIGTRAPVFAGATMTRESFVANETAIDPRKELDAVKAAVSKLSPVPLAEKFSRPHVPVRGMKDVLFWEGTNTTTIVASFIEDGGKAWNAAIWTLIDGDDIEWARERFLDDLLAKWDETVEKELPGEAALRKKEKSRAGKSRGKAGGGKSAGKDPARERELLRADAAHGVANYPRWHVTDAPEFTVLDDLRQSSGFVSALTNELSAMRVKYAAAVPGPVMTSNVLCVARIDVAGEEMKWSAAYWSPARRELVAYLPPAGDAELLRTVRHEAFHQYLSYATAMIPVSPWLNEGYAQYFEDEENVDWKLGEVARPSKEEIAALAKMLPAVMRMDYAEFYAGTDAERRLKYRLAWSIAYFLEKGAPELRFRPWENLKKDYVADLMKTHDMLKATSAAFGSQEKFDKFISDWREFWQ